MKKLPAVLAAILLATAAHADATFCLSAAPAGAPESRACWAIPDASLGDLIEAYAVTYFPGGVQVSAATTRPDGTSVPAVTRAPTPQEVLAAMGNGLKEGVLANVQSYKRAKAAAAAAAAVAPISATAQQ